jgi:hypothetical protein
VIRRLWLSLPARSRPRWLRPIVAWAVAFAWPSAVVQPAAPSVLPVAAELGAGALVVTWPPPTGQAFACVFAEQPDRLLGCSLGATAGRYQQGPGSVDIHAVVRQGETLEVRVYALSGAVVAQGTAGVRGRVLWLPVIVRR